MALLIRYLGPGPIFYYMQDLEEKHKGREKKAEEIRLKRIELVRKAQQANNSVSYSE